MYEICLRNRPVANGLCLLLELFVVDVVEAQLDDVDQLSRLTELDLDFAVDGDDTTRMCQRLQPKVSPSLRWTPFASCTVRQRMHLTDQFGTGQFELRGALETKRRNCRIGVITQFVGSLDLKDRKLTEKRAIAFRAIFEKLLRFRIGPLFLL